MGQIGVFDNWWAPLVSFQQQRWPSLPCEVVVGCADTRSWHDAGQSGGSVETSFSQRHPATGPVLGKNDGELRIGFYSFSYTWDWDQLNSEQYNKYNGL